MAKFFTIIIGIAVNFGALGQESWGEGPRPFWMPRGAGRDGGATIPPRFQYPYYNRPSYEDLYPPRPPWGAKPISGAGGGGVIGAAGEVVGAVVLGDVFGCQDIFRRQYLQTIQSIKNQCDLLSYCRNTLAQNSPVMDQRAKERLKYYCDVTNRKITALKREAAAQLAAALNHWLCRWIPKNPPSIPKC